MSAGHPWAGFIARHAAPPTDDAGADEQLLRLARVERQVHMPVTFSMALPRDPGAGSLARQAVRDRLGEAVPAATLADVTLVVSELVANAVMHGAGEIGLRLEVDGLSVKGEVIDAGSFERPIRESGRVDGVGGLGLFIVAQLAQSWGIRDGTAHVWFEIPVDGAGGPVAATPDPGRPAAGELSDA
ncbi:MAG: serine/threonine-protein kinase RsbW [Solirubrobacteraceae bacterium]|jgi:anti-sigma regulatory factor (Ser/Thr protein kinase)|nr:serine/threonine-protein kinase RsbW [Solirubrobacteraceae bacterium]